MSKKCVISVDLGGTNLRVGAVDEEGRIVERLKKESQSRSRAAVVLGRVAESILEIAKRVQASGGTIRGVALGFPGIVDGTKGIVYRSPHFPDWKDLDLRGYFQNRLEWPLVIDNDATLAAVGEGWKGAGVGLKNFVMLTLGTGIGGGLILNGKPFHGDRGFAGEVGHIVIAADGARCACGGRGCLETYASSHGITRMAGDSDHAEGREVFLERAGKSLEGTTVRKFYEAARDGDIFAASIFKKMGYYLGIGIASLANTLGVENFILGGGISEAWDFFIEPARKELAQRTYAETAKAIQIRKSKLGDDAALVGGAAR